MLTRIVKLPIRGANRKAFTAFFEEHKTEISQQPGCISVQLLSDQKVDKYCFTLSIWENESYLEAYKNSDFFSRIWPISKSFFWDKPEAWSLYKTETFNS